MGILSKLGKWLPSVRKRRYEFTKFDQDVQELFQAGADGDFEECKALLKDGININAKDASNTSILIVVCQSNHQEEKLSPFVEYLVNKGAIIERTDVFGKSAMDYAEISGCLKVKKYLCESIIRIREERLRACGFADM